MLLLKKERPPIGGLSVALMVMQSALRGARRSSADHGPAALGHILCAKTAMRVKIGVP